MRNWRIIDLGFLMVLLVFSAASALPPPPSFNAQANFDSQTVALTWGPVGNAVGFNVYRKERTDPTYQKLTASPVTSLRFVDRKPTRGRDYLYMVRSLDSSGTESPDSLSAGAPLLTMSAGAKVFTTKDKPTAQRSIKTGQLVTFATTGDLITYQITYANQGFSSAKDIKIDYAIPAGTVIAGPPRVIMGAQAKISYFNRKTGSWQDRLMDEEDIGKVRFNISDSIPPVLNRSEASGSIVLNVIINI
ncbi:MAG: hypothetical protein WC645_07220 [Candidatus Margulisiibacteriota bacterium]